MKYFLNESLDINKRGLAMKLSLVFFGSITVNFGPNTLKLLIHGSNGCSMMCIKLCQDGCSSTPIPLHWTIRSKYLVRWLCYDMTANLQQIYLSHFKSDFDAEKSNVGLIYKLIKTSFYVPPSVPAPPFVYLDSVKSNFVLFNE